MKPKAALFILVVWSLYFGLLLHQAYKNYGQMETEIRLLPLESIK